MWGLQRGRGLTKELGLDPEGRLREDPGEPRHSRSPGPSAERDSRSGQASLCPSGWRGAAHPRAGGHPPYCEPRRPGGWTTTLGTVPQPRWRVTPPVTPPRSRSPGGGEQRREGPAGGRLGRGWPRVLAGTSPGSGLRGRRASWPRPPPLAVCRVLTGESQRMNQQLRTGHRGPLAAV